MNRKERRQQRRQAKRDAKAAPASPAAQKLMQEAQSLLNDGDGEGANGSGEEPQ